jgi:hypothetical protein
MAGFNLAGYEFVEPTASKASERFGEAKALAKVHFEKA